MVFGSKIINYGTPPSKVELDEISSDLLLVRHITPFGLSCRLALRLSCGCAVLSCGCLAFSQGIEGNSETKQSILYQTADKSASGEDLVRVMGRDGVGQGCGWGCSG